MLPVASDEVHISVAYRPGMKPELPEPQHRRIQSTPSTENIGTAHQRPRTKCRNSPHLEIAVVDAEEGAARRPSSKNTFSQSP